MRQEEKCVVLLEFFVVKHLLLPLDGLLPEQRPEHLRAQRGESGRVDVKVFAVFLKCGGRFGSCFRNPNDI